MNDPLTEIRFWMQTFLDSERTIICSPELESRIKCMIDTYGIGGTYKVRAERWLPDDTVYLFDHRAFEADQAQFLARPPDWHI